MGLTSYALRKTGYMHIVEELIAERASKLVARKRLFRTVRPMLYRILAYDAAVFMADAIREKTGFEAFNLVTNHISPRTAVKDLHNLPASGPAIIMSNHPTGLADGMAVFQAIRDRRPDHIYLANADALRVMPKGSDIIIPVEWVKDKRNITKTRETLMGVRAALDAGKCVVIFPSGKLARMSWRGLVDQDWESSAAMLARKYDVPVIPLKIQARNSWLYYFFSKVSGELRDITLFQELLNKKGVVFGLTFGEAIDSKSLPKNPDEATAHIRSIVESL